MNESGENIFELREKLGNIQSTNEVIILLSDMMKYVCDKLIDNDEKLTKDEQLNLEILLEKYNRLKQTFTAYGDFFEKKTDLITGLIKKRDLLKILSKELSFHSDIITLTDLGPQLQKDLLDIIFYMDSFFSINNFSSKEKTTFSKLLDIVNKGKTTNEKLITLHNEIKNLEGFIAKLDRSFYELNGFIQKFHTKVGNIQRNISYLFTKETPGIFEDKATQNVAFIFKDNLFLTGFFEDIFVRIPKKNHGINTFLSDMASIAVSKNYQEITSGNVFDTQSHQFMLDIFILYEALYQLHFDAQNDIGELKEQISEFLSRQIFLTPKEVKLPPKKLDIFSDKKHIFLSELKELSFYVSQELGEIEIKETQIGEKELLNLKQEIFKKLFQLLEHLKDLSADEKLLLAHTQIDENYIKSLHSNKETQGVLEKNILLMVNIMELYQKYYDIKHPDSAKDYVTSNNVGEKTKKRRKKSTIREKVSEDKKSTFHYRPVLDGHGLITRFEEIKTDPIVAKTIGKTADEIREMIANILSRDKFQHILDTFPGGNGTLEGNYIILGPWGGGKTALIKEFSQDPKIATVEVGKSDIVDMYVGGTEKNVKAIYENAYKIHNQTGKHVFIFLDEVDAILSKITVSGGGEINVQKEIQTMLDGVNAYPGVHTIMLSNVPHKIPIDIYRRMEKTFVLQDLDLSEKVDLIYSRMDRYPLSPDLREFMDHLSGYFQNLSTLSLSGFEEECMHDYVESSDIEMLNKISQKDRNVLLDLYMKKYLAIDCSKKIENIKKMYVITPKILWQVTERLFKNFMVKFDDKTLLAINRSLGKLKDISDKKKVLAIFSRYQQEITLDDFTFAMNQVFSNASTTSEIAGNMKFYQTVDQMMKMITSSAFDGVNEKKGNHNGITIQIGVVEN